ncbi:nucleotide exchange factor GrpE [Candidatus Daviesbacteria bacterium]|nr:nucleotide exchange factor GrpE [Candidatus Daviesbacteria bacterium]
MAKKQDKVKELEQKIAELDSQLKRAVADYRNLESRVSQGRSELTSFVGAELVKRLLPVLDHLEQALTGISEQDKQSGPALSERSELNGWFKGVELAVKEFNQVLAQEGLDQIPADGVFDPALHEAVDTAEGDDNKILKVVRKGYTLNDKVIRPAQVIVGRKSNDHPERSLAEGGRAEGSIKEAI